jgi:hypothetical protein
MPAGRAMKTELCIAATVLGLGAGPARAAGEFPVPGIPYAPREYVCPWTSTAPVIDGSLDEPAWETAPWTGAFVDIQGPLEPPPRFMTRAKMLWDDSFFYVAAQMEEPDLWATYRQRDAVIYHENDFEVFIDPDGDTHEYYELEINALGTVWDLLLIKPYRDGGPAVNAWDIAGLESAVKLEGSLNDPSDRDRGWSVELAFPWAVLAECAHRPAPPAEGDRWRVNFSRVEWQLESSGGTYTKRTDPAGHALAEDNWVWSPQGLIAMHYPEMWGAVVFTRSGRRPSPDPDAAAAWALRRVYYAQKQRAAGAGACAATLAELRLEPAPPPSLRMSACGSGFTATIPAADGHSLLAIGADGRLRRIGAGRP